MSCEWLGAETVERGREGEELQRPETEAGKDSGRATGSSCGERSMGRPARVPGSSC